MFTPSRDSLRRLSQSLRRSGRWGLHERNVHRHPHLEMMRLEDRSLLSLTLGTNYTGLNVSQTKTIQGALGIYIPPDTNGAAGTTSYVETVNESLVIYTSKSGNSPAITDSFNDFWLKEGQLTRPGSGSFFSDPIVVWDDQIQRFIVGMQDVNDGPSHVSAFDIAVSKTASPASLTSSNWNFYQISTTENDGTDDNVYDADYPGNFGYNHDAFVFTLNMFPAENTPGSDFHAQVNSITISDLANGVPQASLRAYQNDVYGVPGDPFGLAGDGLRPTVMHDSTAGDPMWLISDQLDSFTSGVVSSIGVYKMTNVLSNSASITLTKLPVTQYTDIGFNPPLQPDGSVVTPQLDSRIIKAAESNGTIVASQAVSLSSTENAARWYAIDVSSGTPTLQDQGDVNLGNNTYAYYPSIDINPLGVIGMTFMDSGTNAGQYMSTYVTGRTPADPAGTMETPLIVPAGRGVANYHDFGPAAGFNQRAGDLSGISVDPDGSFWVANEFANDPTDPSQSVNLIINGNTVNTNWGTAIANFSLPYSPTAGGPPLLVLDPTSSGSLSVAGGGQLQVSGGAAVDDSSSSSAVSVTGNGTATAGEFDITGSYSTGGHGAINGTIRTHQPVTADPIGLPLPSPAPAPSYPAFNYSGNAPITIPPGTYVGGIHISGSGLVTMHGVYYMQGGGFTVSGHGSVDGTGGVLIVNASTSSADVISFNSQGNVNLTAPIIPAGPYSRYTGIVIIQTSSNPITSSGQGSVDLNGIVYVPHALVSISGRANVTIDGLNADLIANDLQIAGQGTLTIRRGPSSSALHAAAIGALVGEGGLSGPTAVINQELQASIAAGLAEISNSGKSSQKKPFALD